MDLKLLEHAKSYIDALARGVNPLTGEEIPETEVVNQVRISRCLYFVSAVLGEVLEYGGVRKEKTALLPFAPEQLDFSAFSFFKNPVGITVFVSAINDLRPENMKKLKLTAVTGWLEAEGYLRTEIVNDKKRKRLTEQGAAIGMTEIVREGDFGRGYQVLYSVSAQRFLIEHLSEILKADEKENIL